MINRVHSTLMHDMQTITKNKKICMHEFPKNKKKRKPPDQEFIWSLHYSQLLALYIFLVRSCWESLNSCKMSKLNSAPQKIVGQHKKPQNKNKNRQRASKSSIHD